MVFPQVQTVQQGLYETVVCITTVILYNSQVADPWQGSFASPSYLSTFIFTFSKIFKISISCVCSLATTHFIKKKISISIFYIPTSPSIFKSIITSSPSPILTRRLYTPYKSALYIILTALNLILNYPGLKLTIAVYRGLPTRRPLPYIPYVPQVPYIPIQSSNVIQRRFQPIKAQGGLILKVGNARKASASPQFIAYYFYSYNLAYSYSRSY